MKLILINKRFSSPSSKTKICHIAFKQVLTLLLEKKAENYHKHRIYLVYFKRSRKYLKPVLKTLYSTLDYSFKPWKNATQMSILFPKQFPKDYNENGPCITMTYGQFYTRKTGYALHQCLKECRLLILLLSSNLNHSIIIQTDGLQTLVVSFQHLNWRER